MAKQTHPKTRTTQLIRRKTTFIWICLRNNKPKKNRTQQQQPQQPPQPQATFWHLEPSRNFWLICFRFWLLPALGSFGAQKRGRRYSSQPPTLVFLMFFPTSYNCFLMFFDIDFFFEFLGFENLKKISKKLSQLNRVSLVPLFVFAGSMFHCPNGLLSESDLQHVTPNKPTRSFLVIVCYAQQNSWVHTLRNQCAGTKRPSFHSLVFF